MQKITVRFWSAVPESAISVTTNAKHVFNCITHGDEDTVISARQVVNAAGHGATALANAVLEDRKAQRFDPVMYKGNYFSLTAASPFSRLVYPVPEKAGLGVHLTIDLAGRARFGPDVEPIESFDYAVDPDRSRPILCGHPSLLASASR